MGAPHSATRARAHHGRSRVRLTMNRRDYYINCTKEFAAADRIYPRGKSRRNFPSRAATRQPCILYSIYIICACV